MKKLIFIIHIALIMLLLNNSIIKAQSGSRVQFKITNQAAKTDNNLVKISANVDTKQAAGDGIKFTLVVNNNSGKLILVKNMADLLLVALYNEAGLDISVPNQSLTTGERRSDGRKWKYQSESVQLGKLYINGQEQNINLKTLEYISIPPGGECKINLAIKNVKQVQNPKEVHDKIFKPTTSLLSGKYKLKLFLSILVHEEPKTIKYVASYESPLIDVDYK